MARTGKSPQNCMIGATTKFIIGMESVSRRKQEKYVPLTLLAVNNLL